MTLLRSWTEKEDTFVKEYWGVKSVNVIAQHLNRAYDEVIARSEELGLDHPELHYDGISRKYLQEIMQVSDAEIDEWKDIYSFPFKEKQFFYKERTLVVSFEDFWKWAEKHQSLLDFSKMEPLILGKEPAWMKEKRIVDRKRTVRPYKTGPWTDPETDELFRLVNSFRYTYPMLARKLNRSEASIRHRLFRTKFPARPLYSERKGLNVQEMKTIFYYIQWGYDLFSILSSMNERRPQRELLSEVQTKEFLRQRGLIHHNHVIVAVPRNIPSFFTEQEKRELGMT